MFSCRRLATTTLLLLLVTLAAAAQERPIPRPFPQPAQPPARMTEQAEAQAAPAPGAPPTEDVLGLPIYPAAEFLTSYDAGQGQRYYVFGAASPFAEIVAYYRTVLRQRGELVFDLPPTHMFEVGRFRENQMAFPPGVTVKDFTWGGSKGYPNPKPGAEPARFPTIIQFVPVPREDRR